MSGQFELTAELREDKGKGASRRLRRLADQIPAIIYGGDKDPQPLSLIRKDLEKALENEAFYSHILTLKVDGKAESVILKAVQRHEYKPKINHLDFLRVNMSEKITMNVPLHFINEDVAPGVKQGGGVISHVMTEAEISCLPTDLPEYLEVDLCETELDQSVHLSQIKTPKGVTLLALHDDNDPTIATIHKPKVAAEEPETTSEEGESDEKSDC